MNTVKIALIGVGMITIKSHIPALMNNPVALLSGYSFQITDICSLDEDKLNHIKQILPSVNVYKNYKDLLNKSDCDAVLIATGESLHPEISYNSLKSGKFVLCEKPFLKEISQLSEIDNLTESEISRLQIGFNKRFYPSYLKLEELKKSGIFSQVNSGSFIFNTKLGKKAGWDGILSNLIHYCDIITSIFGEIELVNSLMNLNESGMSLAITMQSKAGAVVSFLFNNTSSWNGFSHEYWQLIDNQRNRFISDNCVKSVFIPNSGDCIINDHSNSIFWLKDEKGYKSQLQSFYDLVVGKRETPEVGLSTAVDAHILFDKIKKSIEG